LVLLLLHGKQANTIPSSLKKWYVALAEACRPWITRSAAAMNGALPWAWIGLPLGHFVAPVDEVWR